MRPTITLTLCTLLGSAACGFARGAETDAYAERSKDLQEALSKIKAALPEGWEAKLEYGEYELLQVILSVERKQKAKGRQIYENPPGEIPEEDLSVEFKLGVVPFLTLQQVTEIAHQNVVKAKKRMDAFEVLEKSGLHGRGMYQDPLPPCAYKPKNEKEEDALRQYGLLWVDTEPVQLPTHYHKGLSFKLWYDRTMKFSDPAVGKEVEDVCRKISAALVPYGIPPGARK